MRNRKLRKRKLNNKGLTLIEILIAMTLLTIAIVPMLRAFIQVNRYGEKGRNLQQTTTVAQTAMENCKAYNVTDIHDDMKDKSFLQGEYLIGATWHASDSNFGNYFIENMTIDNRNIGMSIELNPISVTSETITKYESCNERLDGIFIESLTESSETGVTFQDKCNEALEGLIDDAYDVINPKLPGLGQTEFVSIDEFKEAYFGDTSSRNYGKLKLKRDIYIKASRDGSGNDVATVTYEYSISSLIYKYVNDSGQDSSITVGTSEIPASVSETTTIYTNNQSKDKGGKLQRIYFYYYPGYSDLLYCSPYDGFYAYVSDNIHVNSENFADNLDVYLIKQKVPYTNDIAIELAEGGYVKNVDVTAKSDKTIRLFHNYGINIGKKTDNQLLWNAVISSLGTCEDKLGLVESETKTLMYDVEIKMYKDGKVETDALGNKTMTGEEILALDGSKINW